MLTRCPHCRTTFRITAEALEMAGGQVRCGRCTQVFDAAASLTEELPALSTPSLTGEDSAHAWAPEPGAGATVGAGASETAATTEEAKREPQTAPPNAEASAAVVGAPFLTEDWRTEAAPPRGRRLVWGAAAAAAALVLGAQLVHQYRATLVRDDLLGGVVRRIYDALGIDVVPRWDPGRYRIRDWVATAERGSEDHASLLIRAEIENGASQPMPQPHVYLALKDRWEAVVASRVFAPEEYLEPERADAPMRAGSTTVAELEVVDPGPDAYGFELDVCVQSASGGVRCANDDVFR